MPNTPVPAAGEAVPAGANIIPALFEEWLSVHDAPSDPKAGYDDPSDYERLQLAIITAEPQTPRDVALMLLADTDYLRSSPSDIFIDRIKMIAGGAKAEATPDPLLTAITNYRNGCIALNSVPDEFITKDNEQEIFDVVYRPHVNVLQDDAPAATTLAGVREAIRLVFDEDALDDMLSEGALRAALAYFDGKAVQQ